jgi:hypothetical protein
VTDAAASSGEVVEGASTVGEWFARALAVKDFEGIAATRAICSGYQPVDPGA